MTCVQTTAVPHACPTQASMDGCVQPCSVCVQMRVHVGEHPQVGASPRSASMHGRKPDPAEYVQRNS